MAERMVETNGTELCTEALGNPAYPPILLIMGVGASMLWWEEGFCRMLADGRRFVIRYDHRDTGRSVTYPPGRPGYTGADLTPDAAGVLDAYGIAAAHLVGVSAGGGIAQELALDCPDRVLSLVLTPILHQALDVSARVAVKRSCVVAARARCRWWRSSWPVWA
jgi:pimeloyl-ACP methyl ester carboxylesterase